MRTYVVARLIAADEVIRRARDGNRTWVYPAANPARMAIGDHQRKRYSPLLVQAAGSGLLVGGVAPFALEERQHRARQHKTAPAVKKGCM